MSDPVNHPKHYQRADGFECIELVEQLPFCEGNAIKYIFRAGLKGSTIEDLRKALWYVDRADTSDNALSFCKTEPLVASLHRAAEGFTDKHQRMAILAIGAGDRALARRHIEAMIEDAALASAQEAAA
jgi:hypothetical protein